MSGDTQAPALSQRLMAALSYCGAAPFVAYHARRKPLSAYLRQHLEQSAAVTLFLGGIVLIFAVTVALISVAVVHYPGFYEGQEIEPLAFTISRRLFLVWLVFWVFGISLALLGSRRQLLGMSQLGAYRAVQHLAWGLLVTVYGLVACVAPLALYATHLAPASVRGGDVVMLYEDNGIFPRWVFSLGFLPVTRAGVARFGPGSVEIRKLSEAALRETMREARMVFIGSHGGKQGILIDGTYFPPDMLLHAKAGSKLEYVYLAGCDSGSLRAGWEQAFAPAQVVTHDRLTAVVEHAWWLWRHGPGAVRRLQAAD